MSSIWSVVTRLRALVALFGVVLASVVLPSTAAFSKLVLFDVDPNLSSMTVTYSVPILSGSLDLIAAHDLSGTFNTDLQIAEVGGSSVFQAVFGGVILFSDEFSTDTYLSNTLSIQTLGMGGVLLGNPTEGSGGPTNYTFDLGGFLLGLTQGLLDVQGSGMTLGDIDELIDLSVDPLIVEFTSPAIMSLTAVDMGDGTFAVDVTIPVNESRFMPMSETGFPVDFTYTFEGEIVGHGVLGVAESPNVPTLSERGVTVLTLGLAGAGTLVLVRRRQRMSV